MRIRPHTVAMTRKLFAIALLAAGACMAATKITFDEIPSHLGPFGRVLAYRGFTVTTSDGKTHSGRRLLLATDHLTIYNGNSHEDLSKADVMRIEISQAGRFFHHVVEGALLVAGVASAVADPSEAAAVICLPPILAYAAAATPFFLAADGIAFFIPPKVYEIVH